MPSRSKYWRGLWILLALGLGWSASSTCWAQERRLALLVGHQTGWQGEPRLDYVLSGDLRPLAQKLRALGFRVLTLENQGASKVRAAFLKVRRFLKKHPKYNTFLFYYSGHADQKHFHLGPQKKGALAYQEFAGFFNRLRPMRKIAIFDSCYSGEIIRRFGSLDRYKSLLKRGKTKGIRAKRKIDLHRLIVPKQGSEEGVRIIASSLDVSWELRQHKASVFTYHLLKGLNGPADTNNDGRITIDELFDYTTQRVLQETGQRPQQFLMLRRSTPYAIAPVYRSRLRIGSNVLGKLKVRVANFVWTRRKALRRTIRLAVVDGKGSVSLEHKGQCFRQFVRFPKGGEVQLSRQWSKVPCRRLSARRKGMLYLEAKKIPNEYEVMNHSIAVSGGYVHTHAQLLEQIHWGGGVQLRLARHFGVGLHFITGKAEDPAQYHLSTLWIRPEYGWSKPFQIDAFDFDFYVGAYAQLGLIFQHKGSLPDKINSAFVLGGGGALDLSWWIIKQLGIRIGGLAGFNYTPTNFGPAFSFQWQLQTSIVFRFSI